MAGVNRIKLTELTAQSAVTNDDLFYLVNDPSGTPASKKLTFSDLASAISGSLSASTLSDTGDQLTIIDSDNSDDTADEIRFDFQDSNHFTLKFYDDSAASETDIVNFDVADNRVRPRRLSVGADEAANEGTLHITNTSGVTTAPSNALLLVIEDPNDAGMSLLCNDTASDQAVINFGTPSNNQAAVINFSGDGDLTVNARTANSSLILKAGNDTALTLNDGGTIEAFKVSDTANHITLIDSDSGVDTADEWRVSHEDGSLLFKFFDDSASSETNGLTIDSSGNAVVTTLDTGQGANELYAMDQAVQTTDSVTFAGVTSTGAINLSNSSDIQDAGAAAIQFDGSANTTVSNNLTVTGDLIVNGSTTSVNSTNMDVDDPLAKFADGNASDTLDIGFIGQRASNNIGVIWDESADEFATIFTTDDATTSGNVTISSYAGLRSLYADVDSIKDDGTDAITFDGSANTTITGDLSVNGNFNTAGTFSSADDQLILKDSDSATDPDDSIQFDFDNDGQTLIIRWNDASAGFSELLTWNIGTDIDITDSISITQGESVVAQGTANGITFNSDGIDIAGTVDITSRTEITDRLVLTHSLTASGTNDNTLDLETTLNDPTSEAGTQSFALINGDITQADITGWDNVYLADLRVDNVTQYLIDNSGNVTQEGTLNLANGSAIQSGGTDAITFSGQDVTVPNGSLTVGKNGTNKYIESGHGAADVFWRFVDSTDAVTWEIRDSSGNFEINNGINTNQALEIDTSQNVTVPNGGFVVGSPTGGNQGAGTINAEAVYDDGSLLTDYVLDAALDGTVDVQAYNDAVPNKVRKVKNDETGEETEETIVTEHKPAQQFELDEVDPDAFATKWKATRKLPAFARGPEKKSIGEMAQALLETCETMAVHIDKLNQRIKALEAA